MNEKDTGNSDKSFDDISGIVVKTIPDEILRQKKELGFIFVDLGYWDGYPSALAFAIQYGQPYKWDQVYRKGDEIILVPYPDHFDLTLKIRSKADILAVLNAITESGKFSCGRNNEKKEEDPSACRYIVKALPEKEDDEITKGQPDIEEIRESFWRRCAKILGLRKNKGKQQG
jgi:hypothetical protein